MFWSHSSYFPKLIFLKAIFNFFFSVIIYTIICILVNHIHIIKKWEICIKNISYESYFALVLYYKFLNVQ